MSWWHARDLFREGLLAWCTTGWFELSGKAGDAICPESAMRSGYGAVAQNDLTAARRGCVQAGKKIPAIAEDSIVLRPLSH